MNLKPDLDRIRRCGIPEVVYGQSKTLDDLREAATRIFKQQGRVIITKIDKTAANELKKSFSADDAVIEYNERGRVFIAKDKAHKSKAVGQVLILAAGTSDTNIAEEARAIAQELGLSARFDYDVGVAGLHRLLPALEDTKDLQAIIVVAGMEGALPSVVSGLVDVPVIGVPSSVGYGVGAGGVAALNTMLNSCTPVAVVNIDNGFGAAVLAYQIARRGR